MIPLDIIRCDPEYPDHYCWNCKRFINHPKQVVFERMAIVTVETSKSEACMYMPISHLERKERG